MTLYDLCLVTNENLLVTVLSNENLIVTMFSIKTYDEYMSNEAFKKYRDHLVTNVMIFGEDLAVEIEE